MIITLQETETSSVPACRVIYAINEEEAEAALRGTSQFQDAELRTPDDLDGAPLQRLLDAISETTDWQADLLTDEEALNLIRMSNEPNRLRMHEFRRARAVANCPGLPGWPHEDEDEDEDEDEALAEARETAHALPIPLPSGAKRARRADRLPGERPL